MSDPGGNRLIVRRVKQIVECSVVLSQCNFTDNLSVHGDFLCVLLTDDRQTSNDDHCKGRNSQAHNRGCSSTTGTAIQELGICRVCCSIRRFVKQHRISSGTPSSRTSVWIALESRSRRFGAETAVLPDFGMDRP